MFASLFRLTDWLCAASVGSDMAPRWIEKDATKAKRLKAARAEHDALVARHASSRVEREAFRAEQDEAVKARSMKPKRMVLTAGVVERPAFSEDQLAAALSRADPFEPRILAYPEVMTLRERGFVRPVTSDDPRHPVPIHKGDVLTDEGAAWLKTKR